MDQTDRQLELLERIARAVGVTQTDGVSGITIGQLYMARKASRPRGRAWQLERNLLRPFVVRFWRRTVATITSEDWEAHRVIRRTQKTRRGLPPREVSLNVELVRTKGMFTWGVQAKRIPSNPLAYCKQVKTRRRRESWFTAEQIDRLIDFARELRWKHQQVVFRALVAVMADTGLRISEALGLRWDRITLRGTTPVTGKGGHTRVVAFTPRAMELLSCLERLAGNPTVFVNWHTCKAFDATTVRDWFTQVIKAAGLEHVKAKGDLSLVPHNLRHSAASIADERGAPASWIQAMLGHKHISTTMVYLHRNEQDAALRMAAIMGNRKGPRRVASENALDTKEKVASATRSTSESFS